MGHGKLVCLSLLALGTVGVAAACGSAAAPAAPDESSNTGGKGDNPGKGGSPGTGKAGNSGGGAGGKADPEPKDAGSGGAPVLEPDANADVPPAPDMALPPEPDAAGPPSLDMAAPPGEFPLAAVKAAKPALYIAANAHPEGATYRDGELFFAADGAGWGLMRVDAGRKLYRYHPKLQPIGSYLLADGSMLYCDHVYVLVQVFKDGSVAQLATDFGGQAIENCNDVTVDGQGNLYVTARHTGFIYRITPAGAVAKVAGGLDLPNGVEVDRDSKYLYFGTTGTLERVLLPQNGSSTFPNPEKVAAPDHSDGMQFDTWGNLWVVSYGAKQIIVYTPDGKVITTIGVANPINLTFGGQGNDTIFVESDFKGIYQIGPIAGLRGFSHPGAAKYTVKKMLDLVPANELVK